MDLLFLWTKKINLFHIIQSIVDHHSFALQHEVWLFHTHFRVLVMLIIEDPTVKCSTAIKMLYYTL
jgi:hypothetical protein